MRIRQIFMILSLVSAVISCRYQSGPGKIFKGIDVNDLKILNKYGLSGNNKPNGLQYRLRYYIHPGKPDFVKHSMNDLELYITEKVNVSWFCFYRTPAKEDNYLFVARLYLAGGDLIWEVDINKFLSFGHAIEVQDIKFDGECLFFNAACISYAIESDNECSSLICIDPIKKSVIWETPFLTSNGIFIFYNDYLISSYGFTNEKDFFFVVDKSTGEIVKTQNLPSACDYMEIKNDTLFIIDYERDVYSFDLDVLLNQ